MKHFLYPNSLGKIKCVNCGSRWKDNLKNCLGKDERYSTLQNARNLRVIHADIWLEFLKHLPRQTAKDLFLNEEEEEDIKHKVVIPESIIPNFQCYKEYTHKQKTYAKDRWEALCNSDSYVPPEKLVQGYYLKEALECVPLPHETPIHERLMPYRIQVR